MRNVSRMATPFFSFSCSSSAVSRPKNSMEVPSLWVFPSSSACVGIKRARSTAFWQLIVKNKATPPARWQRGCCKIASEASNCPGSIYVDSAAIRDEDDDDDDQEVYDEDLEEEVEEEGDTFRLAPPVLPSLVAKLFGSIMFEASKLKVLFLGVDRDEHPARLSRIYTLTHNDITANLTLAISHSINKSQLEGWYTRLQRDDVVAKWTKCQGVMSLHVHCHISGGHLFLNALARLRFSIFRRELPVVLEAFRHGDSALLQKHPELQKALVWVHFHSNVKEFDRVECWGPLGGIQSPNIDNRKSCVSMLGFVEKEPRQCNAPCDCCFPR